MNSFFEYFDDYLLRDIDAMQKLSYAKASSDGFGRCGFQMVLSICTFCEILGSLDMNNVSSGDGETKFNHFFINHLPEKYHTYSHLIYQFARHRIAHDFITAPGLMVLLDGNDETHLGEYDGYFVIDVFCFIRDVKTAYEAIKTNYEKNREYKNKFDAAHLELICFLNKKKEAFNKEMERIKPKRIVLPSERDIGAAVPSISYMDGLEFEKLPDSVEDELNKSSQQAASGCNTTEMNFTRLPSNFLKNDMKKSSEQKITASGIKLP